MSFSGLMEGNTQVNTKKIKSMAMENLNGVTIGHTRVIGKYSFFYLLIVFYKGRWEIAWEVYYSLIYIFRGIYIG